MKKIYRNKGKIGALVLVVFLLLVVRGLLFYPTANVKADKNEFIESSRKLRNPKRGFYQIYSFLISDERNDYEQYVKEVYEKDVDTTLSLVEINLCNYRESAITKEGMTNIKELFTALANVDKQLIVRFLYDWNGENEKYEPESIDTILTHIEQLGPVIDAFSSNIFILQGLFIGHWGEMHGTQYSSTENMQQLMERLNSVVEGDIYFSVRTPLQWRNITGLKNGTEESLRDNLLATRLSLFNDGMLGSESDYGTYKIEQTEEGERIGRQAELEFQEVLCRTVPNGGEVICDNPYNDFDNAVKDLSTMHITYLNNAYDEDVLEKWESSVVMEEGCFNGMDGLSYIECHLGYRMLITDADFVHKLFDKNMTVSITMKNVGFAPMYSEPKLLLSLYSRDKNDYCLYEMQGKLCSLSGGNDTDQRMDIKAEIDLSKLQKGKYEVYLLLVDSETGDHILLANEQDEQQYGYFIGTLEQQNGFEYLQMLLESQKN